MIYIIKGNGKPLTITKDRVLVRYLQKIGVATVVNRMPLTIQLRRVDTNEPYESIQKQLHIKVGCCNCDDGTIELAPCKAISTPDKSRDGGELCADPKCTLYNGKFDTQTINLNRRAKTQEGGETVVCS